MRGLCADAEETAEFKLGVRETQGFLKIVKADCVGCQGISNVKKWMCAKPKDCSRV